MTREEATIQSLRGHIGSLEETIKALEQKTRWIPVSERLPEICQEDCHGNITFSKTVLTTQIYGGGYVYVGINKYTTNNGGGWLTEVPFDNPEECCKVIAWMPFPEPYRAESEGEENEKFCYKKGGKGGYFNEDTDWNNIKCAEEHRQLAEWLKDYKRLKEQEPKSPCDVCRYNPPGSGDGKPCTMCPADATERFKNKLESGYFRKRREV